MKKRIFSLLCVLAVALVFALTAQTVSLSWIAVAEETVTTRRSSEEEPYVEPTSSTTTTTQPPMPTTTTTTKKEEDSTSKAPESSTDPTNPTTPTDPTTQTTAKPPVSETDAPATSEHASEKDTTKDTSNTTTTKKNGPKTTTRNYYTTTKPYVPRMTIPQVENTTVEGTTLNPLDAYFERISGDSNTFTTVYVEEETQAPEPEEIEHKQLSTIAIVAICLGGIALVTVGLTAAFALRNKHADDAEDIAADYEQNAYGAEYDAPEPDTTQTSRPQVDESDSFTVVSLDDKDYKD